jgi:hypothetical protein
MAQGEPSFLSVVIDPDNIQFQHFLMLMVGLNLRLL